MSIEIPEELMHPTVEELEARNAVDMAKKWKPCRKPGKRERYAIKRQKESEKLREIANEFDKTKQLSQNSLSALFSKTEKTQLSLADMSMRKSDSIAHSDSRPTLRVSLGKTSSANSANSANSLPHTQAPPSTGTRRRGRPPRVNPL